MKHLGNVESTFQMAGRGIVIVPTLFSDIKLFKGDTIQLRATGGKITETRISAIESINQGPGKPRRPALVLPLDIASQVISAGTEIWAKEH